VCAAGGFSPAVFIACFCCYVGGCESKDENAAIEVQWMLLEIDCIGDMYKTLPRLVPCHCRYELFCGKTC
jgi:hypothetical protein